MLPYGSPRRGPLMLGVLVLISFLLMTFDIRSSGEGFTQTFRSGAQTIFNPFQQVAQAVIDPRGVLKEFGLELDDDVEVRVWDSTAEVRYLVIPERPAGTDGMSVDELAELVTRDSMVGAEVLESPA